MTKTSRFILYEIYANDEEHLNQLYSEKSLDGAIKVNLDRNPGFFEALCVEGRENNVFAVEDIQTGDLAGASIRSIRECYINGKVKKIGYLSGLRVAERYRKTRVLAMFFTKLRQLYKNDNCSGYLYSVFNTNKTAIKMLTSGKAGIPIFKSVGLFNTYVFKPKRIFLKKEVNISIRQLQPKDLINLIGFLNTEGQKLQYFPKYTQRDFFNKSGLLKNLKFSDIYIAIENNEIMGCLALWDQTPFRRWKVEGYSPLLKVLRPILNIFFKTLTLPQLPEETTSFNYRLLSLVCIRNNNRNIFAALYNRAIRNIDKKGDVLISASFFNTDPLIQALPKLKIPLKSTIFIGYWKETQSEIDAIDERNPYIESGSL